jgi:uncharacterized protein (DUF1810 family)
MIDKFDLNRFIEAQFNSFDIALNEIKNGKKYSHWMWYVFPQYKGLGFSSMAQKYSISCAEEAKSYLNHPVLGNRLIEISNTFFMLQDKSAYEVLGDPDYLKMKSSMTLFSIIQSEIEIFSKVLNKYYEGELCLKTQAQINIK